MKDKKEFLTKLKKGTCVLLACTLIGTFAGCSNKKTSGIESTINALETANNILFEREDGAVLQLLASYNPNTSEETFKAGYITYDENGVYFDNALTSITTKISDESRFGHLKFLHASFSSICNDSQLLNGKLNEDEVLQILNGLYLNSRQTYALKKDNSGELVLYVYLDRILPNHLMYDAKGTKNVYTIGKDEAIIQGEDTTYSDSEENLDLEPTKAIK